MEERRATENGGHSEAHASGRGGIASASERSSDHVIGVFFSCDAWAMKPRYPLCPLILSLLAIGCANPSGSHVDRLSSTASEPDTRARFFPPPLADDWTRWMVGEWEGAGTSDAGKGRGVARFELALGGQFLICRGEAEITGLDPDYLKKHMHASDAEIERFRRAGYQQLEIYTVDPKTGEVIGFLFDSLRCVATGRGRREGSSEIMDWEWRTGHRSTRITERVSADRMRVTERTPHPDGSVMEDRGEMTRVRTRPIERPP